MKELIRDGIEKLSLKYNENQIGLIFNYCNELELWNKKLGLVNAEGRKLVINHILDSLSGVSLLKSSNFKTLADVGSGAGLPGIPLSIFFPDKKITLIERSGSRAAFLRNCKELLRLDNIEVMELELKKVNYNFDVVIFRAFRNFNDFLIPLRGILSDKGFLFAYKGKKSEIDKEIKKAAFSNYKIEKINVPFLDEERNIVIVPAF